MRLFAYAAAALSLMVAGAVADPINERKELMKERGALMASLRPVAQGEQAFDAATVLDVLERISANAEATTDVDRLWAPGTETGSEETRSSPRIWEDREGFQAISDKYAADAAAAVEAAPHDLDSFRAAFGTIAGNCGVCHEPYRL